MVSGFGAGFRVGAFLRFGVRENKMESLGVRRNVCFPSHRPPGQPERSGRAARPRHGTSLWRYCEWCDL